MAITRRPANRHTVVATGWTDPANAYALIRDLAFATLASAKNATRSGDFGFPNITTSPADVALPPWDGPVNDAFYGNGYWVVVGGLTATTDGRIAYSTVGSEGWTTLSVGTNTFLSVAYGNGYWVATGVSGQIYYTTDPTGTWTQGTSLGSANLNGVHYDNGYWVAVDGGGDIHYRATDPAGSWTSNTIGSVFNDVHYGNGYWVVVGAAGADGKMFYQATNPTGSWTETTPAAVPLRTVHYGNGYWVMAGNSGTLLYRATDPTGAFTSNSPEATLINRVFYGNGYWIVLHSNGNIYYRTTDPTSTWTLNASYTLGNGGGIGSDGTNFLLTSTTVGRSPAYRATDPTGAFTIVTTEESGIPDSSVINSVTLKARIHMSAIVTGGVLGLQPRINNANSGTELVDTTNTSPTDVSQAFGTVTLSDLRSAESSDLVEVRARVTKGSTNTAMTGNIDYLYIEVDYTPPAVAVDNAHLIKPNIFVEKSIRSALRGRRF